MVLSIGGSSIVVSHLLVGTFWEAYLSICTQEMVRRAGVSLWPALSPIALCGNRKYITAVSRADVGLDGMLKASPGTPGLSEPVYIGFGNGECWNSH